MIAWPFKSADATAQPLLSKIAMLAAAVRRAKVTL